ncbi:hypothetical protein PHET_10467, partial [Paragonimus heterotremus]
AALTRSRAAATSESRLKENLTASIHEFNYDPSDGVTFSSWYQRYGETLLVDAAAMDEFVKILDLQSKALIFVAGLKSSGDAGIRKRLLAKLDSCVEFSFQELTAEYMRLVNFKRDSQMLQSTSSPTDIASVGQDKRHNRPSHVRCDAPFRMQRPSPANCLCGQWHFARFCSYRRHVCQQCNRTGHKESHCRQTARVFCVRRQPNVVFNTTGDNVRRQKHMTLNIGNHQVA